MPASSAPQSWEFGRSTTGAWTKEQGSESEYFLYTAQMKSIGVSESRAYPTPPKDA
jgi:hypothetical protein